MIVKKALFRNVRNLLVYSNIWVALSVASLTKVLNIHTQIDNLLIVIFNFCAALAGYNYMYLAVFIVSPYKLKASRLQWLYKHKTLIITITLVAALISGYVFLHLESGYQNNILLFVITSVLYIIPSRKNIGLRWIPGLKILVIASCWTLLATLPLQQSIEFNAVAILATWLFIIGLTIPFDIRDIATDPKALKTIPQLTGTNVATWLSIGCILVSLILLTISNNTVNIIIGNTLFLTLGILFIRKVAVGPSAAFINFYIEGLPILWLLITMAASLI
ncbi:hypothetical protein KDU71_11750 [Carboxylicivirga sediminis]|uniref:Prenyltransferase n=1 Tax=Carboxylicivirga sediminis TaxID=2006564 RepID=A0A941IY87_9BACT|nr:hypothetical protein [Carboxylicivirga sediminis]MBR8536234.1 hypothetical protein [Carboxylicivirga sediminis]